MGFVREIKYYCGKEYFECDIFEMADMRQRGKKFRVQKINESSDKQKKQNKKNALKKFNRKVHTNFTRRDLYMTFTFDREHMPADKKEAKKEFHNFIKRVNRRRKKKGMQSVKYMGSMEEKTRQDGSHSYHFHFIISGGISREEMEDIWGKGLCNASRLRMDDKELIIRLCQYIMKESANKKKNENTYICSRNLKDPIVKKNDYRISHRQLENLSRQTESSEVWETMYPGYEFLEARAGYSDEAGWHVMVRMKRRENSGISRKKKAQASDREETERIE